MGAAVRSGHTDVKHSWKGQAGFVWRSRRETKQTVLKCSGSDVGVERRRRRRRKQSSGPPVEKVDGGEGGGGGGTKSDTGGLRGARPQL